jgi:hypothetical protein
VEVWTSKNDPRKQIAVAVACSVVGLILAIGFRDFGGVGDDSLAGFLLGVLLLVIGVAGLLVSGRQTVVVDPGTRRIAIRDSNRLRTRERTIPFGDVVSVGLGFQGKRSNFVSFYYLELRLRSGEKFALFAPGRFFPGASDRATVAGWKRRLEAYLGPQG